MKLFLTVICFIVFTSHAQQNWLESYGGGTVEEILDVTLIQNTDLVMAGYFTGNSTYGATTLNSNGNSDISIIKTDATGIVIWAVKAGGTGADRANAITADANGNIYITGSFQSSATFGSITITGQNKDAFVAKMDGNGNFIWAVAMGGSFEDVGYGVEVDNSGNVFCTGKYKGAANFGSTTLVSTTDPSTSLPSFDVFLTKLDANGNILWVKDGKAKYDDRGIAIAVDDLGKCYLTVEFSDTIYFDNTYNNAAPNAGLVLCVDANGNEQWASYFRAGQTLLNDIKWKNNKLYLTGDFRNNLAVEDVNNTTSFSATYDYYTFVSRFSDNGDLDWLTPNFSDNEIYSNQLTIDNNDNIYTVGLFRCNFTEMNQIFGNSTFLSVGYRDINYNKYSNSGLFQWSRQMGSNKDDYSSAITIKDVDFPIIAGSFENVFNVPKGNNFNSPSGSNGTNISCGSDLTGAFKFKISNGSKDVFVTSPFDINVLPYDYYSHTNNICTTDTLPPCISLSIGAGECMDTLEFCYTIPFPYIYVNHHQLGSLVRPIYNYAWNNGSSSAIVFINASQSNVPIYQNYNVQISREDGCASWTDTVVVQINPLPPTPLFTDVWNYNNQSSPPNLIDTCLVNDSLKIYTSTLDTNTTEILWTNGDSLNDSTIYVSSSGTYYAIASNIYGCSNLDSVMVNLNDFAVHDTLDPYINIFYDPNTPIPVGDTVYICEGTALLFQLFDSSYVSPDGSLPGLQTYWSYDSSFPPDTVIHSDSILYYGNFIQPILNSGWHNISAHLVNKCGDTIDYYLDRDFYVEVIPNPQLNVIGPIQDCPNATVTIYAQHNTDTVYWTSGNILNNYGDSIDVVLTNPLNLVVAHVDTTSHGTTCGTDYSIVISTVNQAEIVSSPINGVICMGDSALLSATNGDFWYWISPNGDTIGTNQTLYVTAPGIYNCIIGYASGCNLVSNFIEIIVYDNPEMIVTPGAICNGDDALIEIFTTATASINWLPPFSGSSTTQTVTSGGVYYCEIGSCNGVILDSVIVYESNPQVSLNFSGDTLICPSESVFIQATTNIDSASFLWNTNLTDSSFTTSNAGQYFVTVSDTLGCIAKSDTITVGFKSVPQTPSINDTTVCKGTDVLLQANSQNTVEWYTNNQLINTGDSYTIVNIQTSQNYQLVTSNGICSSSPFNVNVYLFPNEYVPNIIGNTEVCEGDEVILALDTTVNNFLINWTTPNGILPGNQIVLSDITENDEGSYGVFIPNAKCVKDTNSITLSVNPLPDLGLPYDTTFCFDQQLMISSEYDLSFDAYYDTDEIHDSIIIYQIKDDANCANTDTLHVNYVDCLIDFPNVFTPDDDGVNEKFYFNIINGQVYHLLIYNRWGNLIYESYNNEWDGTKLNGKKVSDGTYFYIIEYKFFYKDDVYNKQGTVQVFNHKE